MKSLGWFRRCVGRQYPYRRTLPKVTRATRREFGQFISHAEGSLAELKTQTILVVELNFCSSTEAQPIQNLIEEV
jgi:hypothetical protein